MPNTVTVAGPYSKTSWVNGTTPANATNLNNLEKQANTAIYSFNPDVIGAGFVLSGMACSKNGSTANQLDVTSGRAYLVMSDGTLALITATASTALQFTTATPSTTYYLFLKNDGTYQWGTSSSQPTNSLWLCQVATDGSGNISTVTDKRTLNFTLFPGAAGKLQLLGSHLTIDSAGSITTDGNVIALSGTVRAVVFQGPVGTDTYFVSDNTGVSQRNMYFQVYNGTTLVTPFGLGTGNGGLFALNNSGVVTTVGGQATAGNMGAPAVVAQDLLHAITVTTDTVLATYTTVAAGFYRLNLFFTYRNGTPAKPTAFARWQDKTLGTAGNGNFILNSPGSNAGQILNGSQASSPGNNQSCACMPITCYCDTGNFIDVHFQDPSGTPNDVVSVIIERLS